MRISRLGLASRLVATGGVWALVLGLAGCALLEPGVAAPRAARPAATVKLVGEIPPRNWFEEVGRVEGSAPSEDFVRAVHDARVDLKTQAAAMGATLVRIENVRVPAPDQHGRQVLLVGKAYRLRPPRGRPSARKHVAAR